MVQKVIFRNGRQRPEDTAPDIVCQHGDLYGIPAMPRCFGLGRLKDDAIKYQPRSRCRELLLADWNARLDKPKSWLVYSAASCAAARNIALFVAEAERRIKCPRSTIVVRGSRIAIHSPEFWGLETIRMGLLTILIRAGNTYSKNRNFLSCLDRSSYLSHNCGARGAAHAFLRGRVHATKTKGLQDKFDYNFLNRGFWVELFRGFGYKEAADMLSAASTKKVRKVKPTKKTKAALAA